MDEQAKEKTLTHAVRNRKVLDIVRASKGVPGKPKIRSLKLCGGTGIAVYYEPDVKAYTRVYKPIKKRIRSEACELRTLADGRCIGCA